MTTKNLILKLCEDNFNVHLYPNFLNHKISNDLFTILMTLCSEDPNRRQTYLFGEKDIEYTVTIGGKATEYKTTSWDQLPILIPIKKLIEQVTGDKYTVCVIQYYPNGATGIKPHRDKEMKPGTTIAGLSLGQTRTLSLFRYGQTIPIQLHPGSLYIFHPPTNDYWSHSIVTDSTKCPRISLTFRNY